MKTFHVPFVPSDAAGCDCFESNPLQIRPGQDFVVDVGVVSNQGHGISLIFHEAAQDVENGGPPTMSQVGVASADPGAWHFHGELPEEFARHYTAEYVNEKGLWECLPGKDNHLWDCGVYNLIAADIIGVKFRRKAQTAAPEMKSKPENNPYTEGYQFF